MRGERGRREERKGRGRERRKGGEEGGETRNVNTVLDCIMYMYNNYVYDICVLTHNTSSKSTNTTH